MSCSGCVHSRLIANIVAISRRGSRGLFWIGVRKQPCNRGLDLRSTRPYASITRQSVANDLDVRSATDLVLAYRLEYLDTRFPCRKKSRFIDGARRCSINPLTAEWYIYFCDLRRFAIGPGETAFYRWGRSSVRVTWEMKAWLSGPTR